jgi:hypothetical protein
MRLKGQGLIRAGRFLRRGIAWQAAKHESQSDHDTFISGLRGELEQMCHLSPTVNTV